MKRVLSACALAVVAATGASAAPSPTKLEMTLQPGQRLVMTLGQVPKGEFAFSLRGSSDGVKNFVLSQQRIGSSRFKVIDSKTTPCDGAAGSLYCTGITTPAPVKLGAYIFRVRNLGNRPLSVTLKISWRKITSAE